MTGIQFALYRKLLNKTQKEIAVLIGGSVKTVRSYEQGWRKIPSYVEKQIYFLVIRNRYHDKPLKNCWDINNCSSEKRSECPAWEFKTGDFCWFINGTICSGKIQDNWDEKISICKKCKVLKSHLPKVDEDNKGI